MFKKLVINLKSLKTTLFPLSHYHPKPFNEKHFRITNFPIVKFREILNPKTQTFKCHKILDLFIHKVLT